MSLQGRNVLVEFEEQQVGGGFECGMVGDKVREIAQSQVSRTVVLNTIRLSAPFLLYIRCLYFAPFTILK